MNELELLLVDGDPAALHAMRAMLADYPRQRFATSGAKALALARERVPDLILLDLDLGDTNGLEVCDALRKDAQLSSVPVIVVTSHARSELEVAALAHGANDFVSKPLHPEQFRARVRAQLALHGEVDRHRQACSDPDPGAPSAAQEVPRLLIVDDDVVAIHLMRGALEALGRFYFATSGQRALSMAQIVDPDLIVLDAQMPGMDGFDTYRALRNMSALAQVPIVFVTRHTDEGYEKRALDLGAADFVSKPYSPAVLQARVRNLLDLKRRADAERRSLQEHWRRLGDARVAAIVHAASDAIVSLGPDGRIVLANAAAGQLVGVALDQLPGRTLAEFVADAALPEPEPGVAGELSSIPLLRADGQRVDAEASVSRLDSEGLQLTTYVLRDVAERQRREADLRARAAAEAASLTRSRMLAYVAHEMGNPLNGMLGCTELIQRDAQHPLPPHQAQWLAMAVASAKSMQHLLLDLLDMGRRDNAAFAVEQRVLDAAAAVQDSLLAVSTQAAQAQVTLRFTPPAPPLSLLADPQRLQQCLVNLLANAIKYNRLSGCVEVAVSAEDMRVCIAVRDEGNGMNAEQLAQLFQPFHRLGHENQGAAGGTGLGLVISRQLVEAMGGQLAVESRPGTGSCFTLRLPRSQ